MMFERKICEELDAELKKVPVSRRTPELVTKIVSDSFRRVELMFLEQQGATLIPTIDGPRTSKEPVVWSARKPVKQRVADSLNTKIRIRTPIV